MKLFEKYNKLNITATILIFLVGSCTFYFVLNYVLIREVDESLEIEQQEIEAYVSTHNTLPEIIPTKDQYISFEPASYKQVATYSTTKNKFDKQEEDLRTLQFGITADDKYYLATVAKPLEQTEALLQVIIGVTIVMIALILLTVYLINKTVIRRVWKPFYQTINKVKNYQLPDQEPLKLETADIEEFSLLNHSINEMVVRIQKDYSSLKNFTGQAAHEMQTPLAIIRSNLDALMQNEALLKNSGDDIASIEKAIQRLSRLHQSLLLLTKVENKQFVLNEKVQLDPVIRDKCSEYTEIAESLGLTITCNLASTTILFHQHLIEILINNLLGNAIRYNNTGGVIGVNLQNGELTITNTSDSQQLNSEKIFKPFYRGNSTQDGNGLGLSIVKQICDLGKFPISYSYSGGRHTFVIHFRTYKN